MTSNSTSVRGVYLFGQNRGVCDGMRGRQFQGNLCTMKQETKRRQAVREHMTNNNFNEKMVTCVLGWKAQPVAGR